MPRKKNNKYQDSDADGLPDEVEKFFGTDPRNPDTDGDGMSDGEEIKRGRNPRGPGLLKDLFIPHEGNNFKPKALHPHRLLFYALSSILLKTILIGAVLLLPIEAWLSPDILAEQSKKIISLTNEIRKNLNLPALAESLLLDQAAYDKAQDMLINQYFSHTGPDNKTLADWLKLIKYNFAVAGENLAMGFSGPEQVVNGWSKSPTHYKNMTDPDFREIGVGVTAGLYNKIDTTLVAQYFGAPAVSHAELPAVEAAAAQANEPVIKNKPVKTAPIKLLPVIATSKQILGQDAGNPNIGPQIDASKSKLYVDQPQGQKEKVVRAEVFLSPDTVKAKVSFSNYLMDLKPGADGNAPWTGQVIIFNQDREQIFNPVVMGSVTAENASGEKTTADLNWQNIAPAATGRLAQYYFIKQHQPAYVRPLFDITSLFYRLLLLIVLIALGLNILIQIKKQRPHIILSTLGLAGLLAILIIT